MMIDRGILMGSVMNTIRHQVNAALRHLLNEIDMDLSSPTYGSFDRRYWAWKLVDFSESTFQRNIYPLAWAAQQKNTPNQNKIVYNNAVLAALEYTNQIQHKDGSFDQAFPYEHSFGATAFLLYPILYAYKQVRSQCSMEKRARIEHHIQLGAEFLCQAIENHASISNHIAGAAHALFECADYFHVKSFERKAESLLSLVLSYQSPEGWYKEYEGADPGYQTLCLYYLAQIYHQHPSQELHDSLDRALRFLSYFVHPDGTFAGEYGSRRTSIYYPGGVALLSQWFPLAKRMTSFMLQAIHTGKTISLTDIDMGNLAPLLANYLLLLKGNIRKNDETLPLPWEKPHEDKHFPLCGFYIKNTPLYYAVVGISNGGVMKVFDKVKQKIIWNDCGYIGRKKNGQYITTQITHLQNRAQVSGNVLKIKAPFYQMIRLSPDPCRFFLLRLLNLSVMRIHFFNESIKKMLVRLLISSRRPVPLILERGITFDDKNVIVNDTLISKKKPIPLTSLSFGLPFVSIHMASARYFENFDVLDETKSVSVDLFTLKSEGKVSLETKIER